MKEEYGIWYMYTRRVNQDIVENFFSRMRAIFAAFASFGAVSYKERLRCYVIGQNSKISVETASVHCPADDGIVLTGGIAQALDDLEAISSKGMQSLLLREYLSIIA
jgi:hypothetical protein